MRQIPPRFEAGETLSTGSLRQVADWASRGMDIAGPGVHQGGDGTRTSVPVPEWFLAKITGNDAATAPAAKHAWTAQRLKTDGTLENSEPLFSGTTTINYAISLTGATLPDNTPVMMRRGSGEWYEAMAISSSACAETFTQRLVTKVCPDIALLTQDAEGIVYLDGVAIGEDGVVIVKSIVEEGADFTFPECSVTMDEIVCDTDPHFCCQPPTYCGNCEVGTAVWILDFTEAGPNDRITDVSDCPACDALNTQSPFPQAYGCDYDPTPYIIELASNGNGWSTNCWFETDVCPDSGGGLMVQQFWQLSCLETGPGGTEEGGPWYVLSITGVGIWIHFEYYLPVSEWNCTGPNTLVLDPTSVIQAGFCDLPETLTVYPG